MEPESNDLSRRQFAAFLAAGASLWPIAQTSAQAADDPAKPAGGKVEPGKPDGKPEEPKPAAPEPFNPLVLQLELLERRYPSENLTPEGLRMIASKLAGQMAHGSRLSDFPLTNADGPGFVFSAYRREES